MCNGGGIKIGGGFKTDVPSINTGNSLGEDLLNVVTQVGTGGLVGYEDGKLTSGVTTNVVTDGLKEITGAKAAEEANQIARQQIDDAKAARQKEIDEAKARTAREQMQASRSAASNRKAGGGRSTGERGNGASSQALSKLGSDEQDFLGL